MIQTNDVNHNSWPFGKNGVPSIAAGNLIRFSKLASERENILSLVFLSLASRGIHHP